MENRENMIEFQTGGRFATVSYTSQKHINRIKKLYSDRPEDFKFFYENKDGSVCASFPIKWIKNNPGAKADPHKPKREYTDEQKAKMLENLKRGRKNKSKIVS